jgi:hypothetical protein
MIAIVIAKLIYTSSSLRGKLHLITYKDLIKLLLNTL